MKEIILQFLAEAFTMPTAVFSGMMSLILLNGLFSLIGFNLNSLDAADGLTDGVLDGVADGALDVVTDGALDGVTDGALDGAADGAIGNADIELVSEPGFMLRTGLSDMPKSFFFNIFAFCGWIFTFFGMRHLPDLLSLTVKGALLATLVGSMAVVFAIGVTVSTAVPLAKFFKLEPAIKRRDLIGRSCVVTTLKVTSTFGQAEIDGSSLLVQVRAHEPNDLTLKSHALIYDYRSGMEAFLISPLKEGDLIREGET